VTSGSDPQTFIPLQTLQTMHRGWCSTSNRPFWMDPAVGEASKQWTVPIGADRVWLQGGTVGDSTIASLGSDDLLRVWNQWVHQQRMSDYGKLWRPLRWSESAATEVVRSSRLCLLSGGQPLSSMQDAIVGCFQEPSLAHSLWDDSRGGVVVRLPDRIQCGLAGFVLTLRKSCTLPSVDGVVSVSIFRLADSYRRARKYSEGLVKLVETIRARLPTWEVRVFFDGSVAPDKLEKLPLSVQGAPGETLEEVRSSWGRCFEVLRREPHVSLIQFFHPFFQASESVQRSTGVIHEGVFGTFARYLPLFETAEDVPAWACSPRDGQRVFVSDADFAGTEFEHAILRTVQCAPTDEHPSKRVALSLEASSVPIHERETALSTSDPDDNEELRSFCFSASSAARHMPRSRLPPLFAGALCTSRRWPLVWLERFLRDAACGWGASQMAGLYASEVHDPAKRNMTFDRRRMASMRCVMTFGADEAFLTRVVVPMCQQRVETPRKWHFVTCPPVDRVVKSCIDSVQSARSHPLVQEIARGIATAAGVPPPSDHLDWLDKGQPDREVMARCGLFAWPAPAGAAGTLEDLSMVNRGLRIMLEAWVRGMVDGIFESVKRGESLLLYAQDVLERLPPSGGIVGAETHLMGRSAELSHLCDAISGGMAAAAAHAARTVRGKRPRG
jgi:hypothetical protein